MSLQVPSALPPWKGSIQEVEGVLGWHKRTQTSKGPHGLNCCRATQCLLGPGYHQNLMCIRKFSLSEKGHAQGSEEWRGGSG